MYAIIQMFTILSDISVFLRCTMPKTDQKEKKQKPKPFAVLKNTGFALGMIHRAAPGFLLVSGLANAANGFRNALTNVILLRYAVNAAQTGTPFSEILTVVLVCFVLHLALSQIVNFYSPWNNTSPYYERNALKVRAYVERTLMEKARRVDLAAYEDPEAYNAYFKARDGSADYIFNVYRTFVRFSFRVVDLGVSAAVLVAIDPWLSLFMVLPIVGSLLYTRADRIIYEANMEKKPHRRAQEYAGRTFYLADYAKEMRTGGFAELMKARFRAATEAQTAIIRRNAPRMLALWLGIDLLQEVFLQMGAAAYAVWQTLGTGRILYGDCLVVINSIANVTYGLLDFAGNFTDLADASLYLQNIRDFLAMPVQITERADALPVRRGDLEFRNVTFTYPGAAKPTIQNLSFTLADGEKLALVGQNGAGKTTIAKLALRLYDPEEGEILYGGVNIKDLRLADYRAAFAVVFQDFKNFAVSVAENVLLHPEAPDERETVLDALEKSGFSEKLKRLPDGADTRLTREFDEQGVNLSGGEGQKLSIARIYAKQADIAILDEPTSALDPLAEYKMYENMMDACRDRSVLFISHRLSSAVLADRVLLLEDGSVAESGTHTELMAADGAYAAMFRMQAEKYRESEDACHG